MPFLITLQLREISGSHGGEYVNDTLLDAPCSLVDVYYVSETLTAPYHQGDDPEVCHLYLQPFNRSIRNVVLYGGSFCIEPVHPGLTQTSGHTDKN
jgi:hypothetical protein